MSYQEALEAAGAKIIKFESFGSYQGDWFCLCEYKGKIGWVSGSFGSCSGCDAFEAEFGWNDNEQEDYQQRLCQFGKGYLDPEVMSNEEVLKIPLSNIDWDDGAKEILKFLELEIENHKNK